MIDFNALQSAPLRDLISARSELKIMLASDGWRLYCAFMELEQAALLNTVVMQPLATLDGALVQEYRKGQYAAFDQVQNHGQVLVQSLTAEIEARPAEETDPPEGEEQPSDGINWENPS